MNVLNRDRISGLGSFSKTNTGFKVVVPFW